MGRYRYPWYRWPDRALHMIGILLWDCFRPAIAGRPGPLPSRLGLRDGEPCSHVGCLNHRTHPCEGCGRIGGRRAIEVGRSYRWFGHTVVVRCVDEGGACRVELPSGERFGIRVEELQAGPGPAEDNRDRAIEGNRK